MGNTSVKANRFNVKRIVYAPIKENTASSYKYDAIKTFAAPMAVQFQPSTASGTLYGGGVKTDEMSKLTGGTLKVDVNKLPIEVRAEICGHAYSGGVLKANKNDQPIDIAIGYEIEQTGKKRELVWFFLCKAKPFGNNNQQSAENINFSTDSLEISVMARELDGDFHNDGDTANADFTDAMADAFLSTVPGGTLYTGA